MTERTGFESALTAWMADETSGGMSDRAISEIIDATSRVRPAPHWLARVREPALRWDHRTGAGTSRRRLTVAAFAALLVLAAVAAVAAGWHPFVPPRPADWNGFRGGPDRASTGDLGPVGRPVLRWRFAAADSVKDAISMAGDLVLAPSQDGVLHAIQLADGIERWRFAPGTSVTGTYVQDGQVFLTDGRGIVHSLDLERGPSDGPRPRSSTARARLSPTAAESSCPRVAASLSRSMHRPGPDCGGCASRLRRRTIRRWQIGSCT